MEEPVIVELPMPEQTSDQCDVVALTGCKWPVDQKDGIHLFCNRPKADSRYCLEHAKASREGVVQKPFTLGDKALLREMWDDGRGARAVAVRLSRRLEVVKAVARSMGLLVLHE